MANPSKSMPTRTKTAEVNFATVGVDSYHSSYVLGLYQPRHVASATMGLLPTPSVDLCSPANGVKGAGVGLPPSSVDASYSILPTPSVAPVALVPPSVLVQG